jgi:hypothetical protein
MDRNPQDAAMKEGAYMTEPVNQGEGDRREFMKKAGKLALLAPAVTFLLSTSMSSDAIAHSGGRPHEPGRRSRRKHHRHNKRRGHRFFRR